MILVAGGTGRLGTILVDRLTGRGLEVRVLTRHARRAAHLPETVPVITGDVRDPNTLRVAFEGVDFVVSAVHGFVGTHGDSPATVDRDGNAHLIDAAEEVGAEMVLMSGVGASLDSPMELFRMKYAAEQYALGSGVPTTIVRATAFVELWIELLRDTATRSGRPLVFGRGDNPINFVSVADVAALVERVVVDPTTRGHTFEIGGPDNLTFNELTEAVQRADGREGAPRHVPPAALRLIAATVGRLKPQVGRQTRAALVMDRTDLTFHSTGVGSPFGAAATSVADLLSA